MAMTDNERIEKVLSELDIINPVKLDISVFLEIQLKDKEDSSFIRVISALENMGLARSIPSTPLMEILPKGIEVVKFGGYIKYLEKLKLDREEDARLRKLKVDLDESNLKLTRFYYNWRWIPFLLSGIAIIISVIAIIISLIK